MRRVLMAAMGLLLVAGIARGAGSRKKALRRGRTRSRHCTQARTGVQGRETRSKKKPPSGDIQEPEVLQCGKCGVHGIGGAVHLSIGQEATETGVCSVLTDKDSVVGSHRGHGHAIAKGIPLREMAAEIGELDEADRCRTFLLQLDPSGIPAD